MDSLITNSTYFVSFVNFAAKIRENYVQLSIIIYLNLLDIEVSNRFRIKNTPNGCDIDNLCLPFCLLQYDSLMFPSSTNLKEEITWVKFL